MDKAISKINKLQNKLNNWIFYSLIALSVFIPLYPKFPLSEVAGTYVAIRLEDILIMALVLFWGLVNITRVKKILSQTVTQSFLLFWIIGAISLISALILTGTIQLQLGALHFLRRVEYMLPFFIASTTLSSLKQVKTFLIAMLITTVLVTLYGFGQIYLDFPVISTTNREFSKGQILTLTPGARPNSTFAGHYDLAAYLSLALVFAATLFFHYRNLISKGIIAFTSLISFALLGLTAARISFVAAIMGIGLSFLLLKKRLLIILLIIATMAIILAVPQLRHRLVATITVNLLEGGGPKYDAPEGAVNTFTKTAVMVGDGSKPATVSGRLQTTEATPSSQSASALPADIVPGEPVNTTELGVYRSFNIRFDVEWPRAIRAFEKNPLLGTGYSSITIATDNDYLRILGETGILGLLSFTLLFFILIKKYFQAFLKKDGLEKKFLISTLCIIFVMFATATFIDIFEASKIAILFWIILGIGWGIARDYNDAE